jgi:hypothetical protein
MDQKWVDLNEVPMINGWNCQRSSYVNDEGVGTLITLTLQDFDNNLFMFVLPTETAARIGWDMTGEAGGFFNEVCEPDRLSDDDA